MNVPATELGVAIIGSGVIGAAIARELVMRGHKVTVIDPAPADGASAGNAGLVVPGSSTPVATPRNLLEGIRGILTHDAGIEIGTPITLRGVAWMLRFAWAARPLAWLRSASRLADLARESVNGYRAWQQELPGFRIDQTGWLWLCESDAGWKSLRTSSKHLASIGVPAELLGPDRAREHEPELGPAVEGGLWLPDEYTVDPQQTTRALLVDTIARGGRVLHDRVVGIRLGADRIERVELQSGGILQPDHVVLATGAHLPWWARTVGLGFPLLPGYGWSITLADPDPVPAPALMSLEHHVVVSRRPGAVRITGGMRIGGRELTQPPAERIQTLRRVAERLLPRISELETATTWVGARPMTPDSLPRIGTSRHHTRVHFALGHGMLGVTLAPATATLIAERIHP